MKKLKKKSQEFEIPEVYEEEYEEELEEGEEEEEELPPAEELEEVFERPEVSEPGVFRESLTTSVFGESRELSFLIDVTDVLFDVVSDPEWRQSREGPCIYTIIDNVRLEGPSITLVLSSKYKMYEQQGKVSPSSIVLKYEVSPRSSFSVRSVGGEPFYVSISSKGELSRANTGLDLELHPQWGFYIPAITLKLPGLENHLRGFFRYKPHASYGNSYSCSGVDCLTDKELLMSEDEINELVKKALSILKTKLIQYVMDNTSILNYALVSNIEGVDVEIKSFREPDEKGRVISEGDLVLYTRTINGDEVTLRVPWTYKNGDVNCKWPDLLVTSVKGLSHFLSSLRGYLQNRVVFAMNDLIEEKLQEKLPLSSISLGEALEKILMEGKWLLLAGTKTETFNAVLPKYSGTELFPYLLFIKERFPEGGQFEVKNYRISWSVRPESDSIVFSRIPLVAKASAQTKRFVIHKHETLRSPKRPHLDIRLEWEGEVDLEEYRRKRDWKKTTEPYGRKGKCYARSFVIPRGRLPKEGEKLLLIETEPHPLEYLEIDELKIPEGTYGAGVLKSVREGEYELKSIGETTFEITFKDKGDTYLVFRPPFLQEGQWFIMKKTIKKEVD